VVAGLRGDLGGHFGVLNLGEHLGVVAIHVRNLNFTATGGGGTAKS
jgi:hypothetical protein